MPISVIEGAEPVLGYRLVRLLGRGGFGEVWEAETHGGVRVALKFVGIGSGEAAIEQRALNVIRNIRHPHLLDVQFALQVEGWLIIGMPLCEQNLLQRLNQCREEGLTGVPRDELFGYLQEAAEALDFLNEPRHVINENERIGIQHRDVKPHNLFLVGGSVRLADFGLAKVLRDSAASHTGSMTPHYAPPEMFDKRVCEQSDQYSLAVTYCQLRCGRLPFEGSVQDVIYGHLKHPPNLSELPPDEREVVAQAMAKQPDERWPNCKAFALEILATIHAPATTSTHSAGGAELSNCFRTIQPGGGIDALSAAETASLHSPKASTSPRPLNAPPPRRVARGKCLVGSVAILLLVMLAFLARERRRHGEGQFEVPRSGTLPTHNAPFVLPKIRQPVTKTVSANAAYGKIAPSIATERPVAESETGYAILKRYCHCCHGVDFKAPGLNVLDRESLVSGRNDHGPPYLSPGRPDESFLWHRIGIKQDMPPAKAPQPNSAERNRLRDWILNGATFPARPKRPFLSYAHIVRSVHDHLKQTRPSDRRFQRYFTLTHLFNDNVNVSDDEMQLYRAALSKAVNSLSWANKITVPNPVDADATILNIDLRTLGWDKQSQWDEIIKGYPYGLKHDRVPAGLRDMAIDMYDDSASEMPFLRADWFVAHAMRSPIYHRLLALPTTARKMEQLLRVDTERDFLQNRLDRAGVLSSGVTGNIRLFDRHSSAYGAYWKSFDFFGNQASDNPINSPLGPVFASNPFAQAFVHTGSEIAFNLPNGLQAYLIVDGSGRRFDVRPVEFVSDAMKISGTQAIVNGFSCISCHRRGPIAFSDEIRALAAVFGDAKDKLDELYPKPGVIEQQLAADEKRFLGALETATARFLKVGANASKDIRDFPEPISAIARNFQKHLSLQNVAYELGIDDPEKLQRAIKANSRLRELGLEVLINGHTLKREVWQSQESGLSLFHHTALELEIGIPHRSF